MDRENPVVFAICAPDKVVFQHFVQEGCISGFIDKLGFPGRFKSSLDWI